MSARTRRHTGWASLTGKLYLSTAAKFLPTCLIVMGLAALAAWAPSALEASATSDIRYEVSQVNPLARDLVAQEYGGPILGSGGTNALAAQDAALARITGSMPAAVRDVVGTVHYTATTDLYNTTSEDSTSGIAPAYISLIVDPDRAENIRLTSGKSPDAVTTDLPNTEPVDILLSEKSAAKLKWSIGEERLSEIEQGVLQPLRLTGIFEATDPHGDYWQHTASTLVPSTKSDGISLPITQAGAYVAPGSWPHIAAVLQARMNVWYPLVSSRLTASTVPAVATALREFTRTPAPNDAEVIDEQRVTVREFRFSTQAGNALQEGLQRAASVRTVSSLIASGPIGVAAILLFLSARLIYNSQRDSLRMATWRGASARQIGLTVAIEGAIFGLVASVLGTLVATIVTASTVTPALVALCVGIGLAPAVLLLAVWIVDADDLRAESRPRRGGLRWILEGLVVALAILSTVLVAGRSPDSNSVETSVDPLLLGAPLLLSLAACAIVLRLYPPVFARFFRPRQVTARAATLVGALRIIRTPAIALVPLLTLTVVVSVAAFSLLTLASVESGLTSATRAQVGADVRLTAPLVRPEQIDRIDALAGVDRVAAISEQGDVEVTNERFDGAVTVLTVDVAALKTVQTGFPGAVSLPDHMDRKTDGRIPVLISDAMRTTLGASDRVQVGNETATVAGVSPGRTAATSGTRWILVDQRFAEDMLGQQFGASTVLMTIAPGSDAADVVRGVRAIAGADATVTDPRGVEAVSRSNPSFQTLETVLVVTVLGLWALCAFSAVMTLRIGAPSRQRASETLRLLGLSRRSTRSLVGWEILPIALVALLTGSALGIALAFLARGVLSLGRFSGADGTLDVSASPVVWIVLVGAYALAVAVPMGLAMRRYDSTRRRDR